MQGLTAYLGAFLNFADGPVEIDWRLWLILPIVAIQLLQFFKRDHFALSKQPLTVRVVVYFGMYCLIFGVGQWGANEFIYFQF